MISLHEDMEKNEALSYESFFGVYKFLLTQKQGEPIIFVIKNIKNFPQQVLNDIIHSLKKYRETPYDMKLNLIIGIQNNNMDEF